MCSLLFLSSNQLRGYGLGQSVRSDGARRTEGAPIETSDNATYILTGNILSPTDGIIVERDNVKIDGNGFTLEGSGTQSSRGFYLLNRINVTISGVTIKGFGCGIYFGNSSNCKVFRSIITANSGYGIAIDYSSHNIIFENNVTANDWDGVMLYSLLNNAISMNNITANLHGIILISSQNRNVSENKIEGEQC